MQEKLLRFRVILLGFLILLAVGVWLNVFFGGIQYSHYFEAHFLDIGQGDATFFETPEGIQLLIDGGRDDSVLSALAKEMNFFDRTIDIVIATHPDSDHITGLIDVLKRFQVNTIIMTENESNTRTAAALITAARAEGADIIYARTGQTFKLGASTTLTILFPDRNPAEFESNASSIIAKIQYGEIGFMLTGDAPKNIEEYLVRIMGSELESEVLKVGHHGSKTSSSENFIKAVSPQYAIISAGKDNRYGHPHKEVINRLVKQPLKILETAKQGNIDLQSDGVSVWQN